MIAASPLSGCPLAKPATLNVRWPSEGKGITIGASVGIVMCQWGVALMYRTPGPKGPSPQRHKYPQGATESYPHPPNPPRPPGVTNVGPTTAIATHNLAGPLCPTRVATPLTSAMHQKPTSQRCGHARRRSTPTPRGQAQTTHTHTQSGSSCCVPFCDRQVHKVTQSDEIRQECDHSSANTLGPVHHMARTHQADDKSKGRKWQHEVRQGDTHDSGFAAIRVSPCQTSNAKSAMVQ